jgi:hypothetical protein
MHQVGYLPGISARCTDNKTLNIKCRPVFIYDDADHDDHCP